MADQTGLDNKVLVGIGVVAALFALIAVAWSFFIDDSDNGPRLPSSVTNEHRQCSSPDSTVDIPVPPEEKLLSDIQSASSDDAVLAILQRYAENPDADWNSPALQGLLLTGGSEVIRKKVFEILRELAGSDGDNAVVKVHTLGVRSVYSDVRYDALAACRETPKIELLDDLLKVSKEESDHQHLAIQALAFMDATEAHQRVLEVAKSEETPKPERIQAILLLSRTNLSEGVGYLRDLCVAEDGEFRAYAMEALDVIQSRRSGE
ncbi:hypothetical protein OAU50_03420 [Planctomycetota bacterium]|nr:hypothetical protein [Planctomycetota bacterium]